MRDQSLPAGDFRWAVGIENTFVPQTRSGHRRLDEYELMGHYDLWRQDLGLAAELGVSTIRYGVPWYRVNPRPGVFDWSWTDEVLDDLVREKRLTPIVDLMHYGTPLWLDNQFVNSSYPQRVAEYAARFAERYAPLVRYYTPLNEPAVTADFCGRTGLWPPYLRGDDGYVKVLTSLARGIWRTAEALRAARPDAVLVHVEDVGLDTTGDPGLLAQAEAAQGRRLLPLDLMCGRVVPGHALFPWLLEHGCTESELLELAARAPRWDVLGVNFYPWTNRRLVRSRSGRLRQVADSPASALKTVLGMVHDRYGLPLMVTETSSTGTDAERAAWLEGTLGAVRDARREGIAVTGYTWFPLFTMIEWKYRWSRKGLLDHLLHLGLYEVHPARGRMDRVPTRLVDSFRRCIAAPEQSVGEFAGPTPMASGLVA
ncbi:Aryl-phospho-beta-D-glucosidase BglA [Aquisphaera giovannonii]|uniref:Aryl-phospho-beta-D-glucosidase BglA n=1 Tax=Aquisphaera giovannonii TaxID=406548 RepID=A0A5B9W6C2_9BACT|nr:family 1 glycosylhydrolase [Aquisphaera giovannonii]QEH35511.1 Aryl-phospho-beta-D-glucosidase BglA [Aquisphaera giovannonii]